MDASCGLKSMDTRLRIDGDNEDDEGLQHIPDWGKDDVDLWPMPQLRAPNGVISVVKGPRPSTAPHSSTTGYWTYGGRRRPASTMRRTVFRRLAAQSFAPSCARSSAFSGSTRPSSATPTVRHREDAQVLGRFFQDSPDRAWMSKRNSANRVATLARVGSTADMPIKQQPRQFGGLHGTGLTLHDAMSWPASVVCSATTKHSLQAAASVACIMSNKHLQTPTKLPAANALTFAPTPSLPSAIPTQSSTAAAHRPLPAHIAALLDRAGLKQRAAQGTAQGTARGKPGSVTPGGRRSMPRERQMMHEAPSRRREAAQQLSVDERQRWADEESLFRHQAAAKHLWQHYPIVRKYYLKIIDTGSVQ